MDNLTLEKCYEILNISSDASLAEIEQHYYSVVAEKLKSGEKQELVNIRQAYLQLTAYRQEEDKNKEKKEIKQFDIYLTKALNQSSHPVQESHEHNTQTAIQEENYCLE